MYVLGAVEGWIVYYKGGKNYWKSDNAEERKGS